MHLLDFQKLPVNTLVGADWETFRKITDGQAIAPRYRTKFRATEGICRLMSLMTSFQDNQYNRKLRDIPLEHDPVFILGHWRSGTTFVHNVLAQDKHFGYTTTYQTVLPHLVMWGQPFFKKTMAALMPPHRPTDHMELKVDLPQEEEFALSNMMPYSYYNFWFFPKNMPEYCDRFLTMQTATTEERRIFQETLLKLIKISLWNTHGTQYLSKNPPHTGKVKEILEIFPNARFIYLIRNPYTVFESTRSFFNNTLPSLQLQSISPAELEANILKVYRRLYHTYEQEKKEIPAGHLTEIKFEDFESAPLDLTETIYKTLSLPGFEEAKPAISAYLDKKKGYRKNTYKYESRTIESVEKHWAYALEQWGYKLV